MGCRRLLVHPGDLLLELHPLYPLLASIADLDGWQVSGLNQRVHLRLAHYDLRGDVGQGYETGLIGHGPI